MGEESSIQQSRWIVIDDQSAAALWEKLLPDAKFVGAGQLVDQAQTLARPAEIPDEIWRNPQGILIHADLNLPSANSSQDALSGIDWAIRFCQERNRFRCPIVLASFMREEDATADDLLLKSLFVWDKNVGRHTRWIRLPQTTEQLTCLLEVAIKEFSAAHDGIAALDDVSRSICKRLIERKHRTYKHGQGSFTTASWLLLGALQSGHLTRTRAIEAVDEIRNKHAEKSPNDSYDFALLKRYFELVKAETPNGDLLSAVTPRRNLLMIEDEYGWDTALKTLLEPGWTVTICSVRNPVPDQPDQYQLVLEDASGAVWPVSKLTEFLTRFQLIFVDENLGERKPSGLALIELIRKCNPFVPIVMFTSNADPAVYTEAVAHGATNLFLKQSSDRPGGYTSKDNFNRFHQIVSDYSNFDSGVLDLLLRSWSLIAFACNLKAPPKSELNSIMRLLVRATFLCSWGAGLSGNKSSAMLRAAAVTIEQVLRDFCEVSNPDIVPKFHHVEPNGWTWWSTGEVLSDGYFAFRMATIAQWADKSRHGRVPTGGAKKIAANCFKVAEFIASSPRKAVYQPKLETLERSLQLRMPTAQELSHNLRSQLGALRFLLGHYLACVGGTITKEQKAKALQNARDCWEQTHADFTSGDVSGNSEIKRICEEFNLKIDEVGQIERRLIIVDDNAIDDGWIRALQIGMCKQGFHVENEPFAKSLSELTEKIDQLKSARGNGTIVLLDLHLPARAGEKPLEQTGMQALRAVKKANGDLPIIIFSAADSAYAAWDCLGYAAQGFFPKTGSSLPTEARDQPEEFFVGYRDRLLRLVGTTAPLAERGRVDAALFTIKNHKAFRLLDSLPNATLSTLLGEAFGSTTEGAQNKKLSKLVADYFLREMRLARDLAWLAEKPYAWILARNLFSPCSLDSKVTEEALRDLFQVPGGPVEMIVKLILAIQWDHWPGSWSEWKPLGLVINKYSSLFTKLASKEFDRARMAIFEIRNRQRDGSVWREMEYDSRADEILNNYTRLITLASEELALTITRRLDSSWRCEPPPWSRRYN